jgi:hypothetical protein
MESSGLPCVARCMYNTGEYTYSVILTFNYLQHKITYVYCVLS